MFLGKKKIYRVVELTERWCGKHLGRNYDRGGLTIYILKQSMWEVPTYGGYEESNNSITIYKNRCESVTELIMAVVHEYVHYLQDLSQYDKLTKQYGYENNPLEVEARMTAQKYYEIIWEKIKNKI